MGTKLCRVCYAQTTFIDGGLICGQHFKEALDEVRARAEKAEAELRDQRVWTNGERITLFALCNEMSPDDAPTVVTRKMTYDAVDRMQDRLFAAEGARDALGIQLAAAQERLRLAMRLVEEVKAEARKDDRLRFVFKDALAALDAVPGDALKKDGE